MGMRIGLLKQHPWTCYKSVSTHTSPYMTADPWGAKVCAIFSFGDSCLVCVGSSSLTVKECSASAAKGVKVSSGILLISLCFCQPPQIVNS